MIWLICKQELQRDASKTDFQTLFLALPAVTERIGTCAKVQQRSLISGASGGLCAGVPAV